MKQVYLAVIIEQPNGVAHFRHLSWGLLLSFITMWLMACTHSLKLELTSWHSLLILNGVGLMILAKSLVQELGIRNQDLGQLPNP